MREARQTKEFLNDHCIWFPFLLEQKINMNYLVSHELAPPYLSRVVTYFSPPSSVLPCWYLNSNADSGPLIMLDSYTLCTTFVSISPLRYLSPDQVLAYISLPQGSLFQTSYNHHHHPTHCSFPVHHSGWREILFNVLVPFTPSSMKRLCHVTAGLSATIQAWSPGRTQESCFALFCLTQYPLSLIFLHCYQQVFLPKTLLAAEFQPSLSGSLCLPTIQTQSHLFTWIQLRAICYDLKLYFFCPDYKLRIMYLTAY